MMTRKARTRVEEIRKDKDLSPSSDMAEEGFKAPFAPKNQEEKAGSLTSPKKSPKNVPRLDLTTSFEDMQLMVPPPKKEVTESKSASPNRASGRRLSDGDIEYTPPSSPTSTPKGNHTTHDQHQRFIKSVKMESDKAVTAFLTELTAKAGELSAPVTDKLRIACREFLKAKPLNTREIVKQVREMQKDTQLQVTGKDKSMLVKLLMIISSCARLEAVEVVIDDEQQGAATENFAQPKVAKENASAPALEKRSRFSTSLGEEAMKAMMSEYAAAAEGSSAEKMCRLCEQSFDESIYEEHVKFCVSKSVADVEAITVDQHLQKMIKKLSSGLVAGDDEVLGEIREILTSAESASSISMDGVYECAQALSRMEVLVSSCSNPLLRTMAEQGKQLIDKKMRAIRSSEVSSLSSPRLPSPSGRGGRRKMGHRRTTSNATKIPTIDDFEIIKIITRGGYGSVSLAKKKTTGDLYAIKALSRKEMVDKGQIDNVLAERNILAAVKSDFVVKMFFAMKDRKYLYLVMEFMSGGDLFTLLQRFGRLDEQVAKFYAAEVLLALEDIHKLGVVHRDIKTDNLLLGANGHVKLSDFGLSNMGLVKKHEIDVVGTPHYLAPEILLGLGHGQEVDWWAYGVVIFYLLYGRPPFDGDGVEGVFRAILGGQIQWPPAEFDDVGPEAKSLITGLLDPNPETRFHEANEVKAHPWFADVDWDTILTDEAPFVPSDDMENPEDTVMFREREERFPVKDMTRMFDDEGDSRYERGSSGDGDKSFGPFWHINVHGLAESGGNK